MIFLHLLHVRRELENFLFPSSLEQQLEITTFAVLPTTQGNNSTSLILFTSTALLAIQLYCTSLKLYDAKKMGYS